MLLSPKVIIKKQRGTARVAFLFILLAIISFLGIFFASKLLKTLINSLYNENIAYKIKEFDIIFNKNLEEMAYVENVKWIEQKFNESSEDKVFLQTSEYLFNKVRIFCVIATSPKFTKDRVEPQKNTFLKRCNNFLYLSSERNSALPSIQTVYKDDYFLSMQKMKNGFKYVYRKYGDQYDWYIKFDDDTYIVMENLRAFLLNKNSSKPQIHGFQLQNKNETEKESWVQGGSGFVMSNSAMKLLTEVGLDDPKYCRQDENVPEDIEIVYCLRRLNVTFGIGVDKHNKPHFSPFPAGEFAYPGDGNTRVSWLKEHSNYILNSDPISSLPIAFHYVSGSATYAMEYLLYKVNVMGRQSMLAHINYSQSELTNKINNYTSHNFV